jgi:allophanate hydrolase subunit 2
LRVWPGPQWEQFDADSQRRLFETEWRVTNQCDRVGYRLRSDRDARPGTNQPTMPIIGPTQGQSAPTPEPTAPGGLAWNGGSLISEPVLTGSIQVPADGQPIVTLHDGPTLGGYPKIGWIDPRDLPRLVQRRSGQPIRFTPA